MPGSTEHLFPDCAARGTPLAKLMAVLPFTISQQKALPQLLDDPSPVVQQALLELFLAHGDESVELLRAVASQPNQTLAAHAARYLGQLNSSDPVGDFRRFIRSLNYELETGALLLSRTVNADLDVGSCCTQLDALAARCRELITPTSTPREQCRILNHVLLQEFGLRGNTEHYTDPLNSFLDQVLIRRKGLPLSLSIVYLLIAERIGLPLEPVALPGHFIVGCYEETPPFFLDPFHAGVFLSAPEVLLLARLNDHEPTLADLAPTPVREVLCRCCRNLAHHYAASEQLATARLFADFVAEFESTHERQAQP